MEIPEVKEIEGNPKKNVFEELALKFDENQVLTKYLRNSTKPDQNEKSMSNTIRIYYKTREKKTHQVQGNHNWNHGLNPFHLPSLIRVILGFTCPPSSMQPGQ